GRDALGDVVVGPGEVVQALGAVLQVAMPPLVEPGLDATQGHADVVDGAAGEAETDGALPRREFVVHGLSSAGQPLAVACGGRSRGSGRRCRRLVLGIERPETRATHSPVRLGSNAMHKFTLVSGGALLALGALLGWSASSSRLTTPACAQE